MNLENLSCCQKNSFKENRFSYVKRLYFQGFYEYSL